MQRLDFATICRRFTSRIGTWILLLTFTVTLGGVGCSSGGSSGGGAAAVSTTPACGPARADDADGDGLSDEQETAGWTILVDYDGFGLEHAVSVKVWSDPARCDTDGDGLTDAEEFAARTDPEWYDTDGDLLDDYQEIVELRSNPVTADTDGDRGVFRALALIAVRQEHGQAAQA